MGYLGQTTKVATPYFDKVLSRQYTRLRKAGVQPWTWLSGHLQLCALVLPLAELERVMASKGDWAKVSSEISTLMASGNLGQTVFTFAGLLVNASQYKQQVEKMLDELFTQEVDAEAVRSFKKQAEEAAVSFKVLR